MLCCHTPPTYLEARPPSARVWDHNLLCIISLQIMAAAMERGDDALRLRACDVLLAAGQHDPQPLRLFIEGAVPGGPPGSKPAEDNRRLLGTLIATLGTPNENGLQEQVRLKGVKLHGL